jgi:hypothetical protein
MHRSKLCCTLTSLREMWPCTAASRIITSLSDRKCEGSRRALAHSSASRALSDSTPASSAQECEATARARGCEGQLCGRGE